MNRCPFRHLLVLSFIALLPLVANAGEGKIRKSPRAVKDEYIVVLRDDVPRADVAGIAKRLTKNNGKLDKVWVDALKGFFVRMNEGQAFGLSHDPDVAYIEENAEMFLSAQQPTNINPSTCTQPDPPPVCTETNDNRLWHLDRVDQNTADLTKKYGYCSDASGVTVYVIDTGVLAVHSEFAFGQVRPGFNASGDGAYYPATNPCAGSTLPAVAGRGHGTGVASVVAGKRAGVAKGATIVPVKVARCGDDTASGLQQFTSYAIGQMARGGPGRSVVYRTSTGGTTGPDSAYPQQWSLVEPVCWGGACFDYVGNNVNAQTTQMMIDGINWIVGSSNTDPSGSCGASSPPPVCGPTVATFSTFRVVATHTDIVALEQAIRTMISRGITVVASANNQNSNACDTTPGRMSLHNPDPLIASDVITVGGTMILNDPDLPGAGNGGGNVGQFEPPYDASKGTLDARWRCGPGDSDDCTQNGMADPPPLAPTDLLYPFATIGSNGGQCVTLFAPAKNVTVADFAGSNAYRNRLAAGGNTSGTSWSAPLVAGVAARILKSNSTMSPQQVRESILENAAHGVMTTAGLDPPGVSAGTTPNIVLRLANVSMATQPAQQTSGGTTTFTALAQTTSGSALTYEWYRVNSEFDLTVPRGAHSSQLIGSGTSLNISTPASATGYWIRVTSDCAVVDSDIVIVDPNAQPPAAPASITATAGSSGVGVTWSASPTADAYHLERKVTGQAWTAVTPASGTTATTFTDAAPPLTDDGIAVYRVRAKKGSMYSPYSALDFAHPKAFTNATWTINVTTLKGVHIVELRKAVNAMADAAGLAAPFAASELLESSLTGAGRFVRAADFAGLLSQINSVRTSAAYGRSATSFNITPLSNAVISTVSQIVDLRTAVQ